MRAALLIAVAGIMLPRLALAAAPALTPQGMLKLKGEFAIDRRRLRFTLLFASDEGRWRQFGIGTDLQ